jgi:hypothetical protein
MNLLQLNLGKPFATVALAAGFGMASLGAHAAPLLRCDVTYAGSTHPVEARAVADPYPVASVDIAGRFRFKAVMVGQGAQIDYIKLYTYVQTPRQPVLIQQATYRPPFMVTNVSDGLTGEQRVYGGPKERELIYRCTLQEVAP